MTLESTNESAENIFRALFNVTEETRKTPGLEKFAFEVNSVKCMISLYEAARRIGTSKEAFLDCFPFQWTGVHTSLYARKMFPAVLVQRLLTLCRYYNVSVFDPSGVESMLPKRVNVQPRLGGSWHLSSLKLCMLMQKRGHGGIELALLSKTNSDAFLKVKEALKEALTGEITDERLEELASNHCERLLCYQGEFAADDGDDGPLTSNELHSCFGRKGGRKGTVQGHFVLTPEFTGYEACEILARLGWSENQIQTRKGVSLYRAYL